MSPREQRMAQQLFVGYAVVASSIGAALSALGMPLLSHPSFIRVLFWHAPVWIAWGVIAVVLDPLARRLESGRTPAIRALFSYSVLFVPVVALHTMFAVWWIWWAHPDHLAGLLVTPLDRARFGRQLPVDILAYCAIAAVLLAIRAWRRAVDSERLAGEARLAALEAQLQPHFLFNALQALSTLIRKDQDSAIEMVNTLSNLLRSSLRRDLRSLVTLDEELALAAAYLAIQQIRFRDRLHIAERATDDARRCTVPPLILQPLLENAFVHGIEQVSGPATLTIEGFVRDGMLIVEIGNDGPSVTAASERIGLASVRERLRNRHGGSASLELVARDGGTLARITMPAIRGDEA